MPDYCALIVNPTSGHYSPDKVGDINATLTRHGLVPEVLLTGGPDDATRFARRICAEHGEPLIIAGGGDGTVNGVVNGLEHGKAAIAVIPLGTANVLARELAISSLDDAVARIVRGETRPMTVGLVEYGGKKRYFSLMAGVGFDGFVVEGMREKEKKALRQGAYLLSAARRLLAWERGRLDVIADGRPIACHSVIVCNASKYGGGFSLAPRASLFCSGFQVICVTSGTRLAYLKLTLQALAGRMIEGEHVSCFSAEDLAISGSKAVQVDGDFCCYSPVRMRTVEGFVRLVI